MHAEAKRRRLIEVDRVVGFAILLVVIGHVVARKPPVGNEWYIHLKFIIYQFHMPLFMFMSGLVYQHTSAPVATLAAYRDWVAKKVARLAPGFLLIGTAITLGKIFAGSLIHVDNAKGGGVEDLLNLFLMPTESAAGSLWYVYVLLEFYLVFPVLWVVFRARPIPILLLTVAMHLAHLLVALPRFLALHDFFEFAMYFWLGAMACAHYDQILHLLKRRGPLFLVLFLTSFASTFFMWWAYSETLVGWWTYPQTLVGLASIPAALWLVGMNTGSLGNFFARLSGYTFVIYLLNTIAIGVTKGIMLKIMPWDGRNFFLFFFVLAAVGIVAPILAHQWIFSRNQTLARIMN